MKRIGRFGYSARMLVCLASVSLAGLLVTTVGESTAHAQADKKARAKMVDLNKQALAAIDSKDFETAKDLLSKAVTLGKQSDLVADAMMARTYVHLGVVWFAGFQDKQKAMRYFGMAKGIRQDIKLTPALATPDLSSLFEESAVEVDVSEPLGPSTPTKTVSPAPTAATKVDKNNPPLPTTFAVPLLCDVPEEISAAKSPIVRCALQPDLSAGRVLLFYRAPNSAEYRSIGMTRAASGWYEARIPPTAMTDDSLQVYFAALDATGEELATNGREDSPSVISVKLDKRSGTRSTKDEDPLGKARRENEAAEYESGLHRRRQGAVWVSFGAGAAWGYSPAGVTPLEGNKQIKSISPIATAVGYYHLLPEIGYMIGDNFGLALQMRYEVIFQQQLKDLSSTDPLGAPKKSAIAGILRGIYYIDLLDGNLQFTVGGDLGVGALRYPIRPVLGKCYPVPTPEDPDACEYRSVSTIYRTDTIYAGPVILGSSAGLIYHFTRWLAVYVEGRGLAAFPKLGFALEGQASLQVAFGGGKSSDGPTEQDREREIQESESSLSDPPSVE